MKRFSIIMPTRNRAQLLRYALHTAANQTNADYEIVVCDNHSTDDTKAVVSTHQAEHPQIRYINPGKDLSMCDNWEFALQHAKGEYIIYLSDDDALAPGALAYLNTLLTPTNPDFLIWQGGAYNHPDIPDPAVAGLGAIRAHHHQLYQVQSQRAIQSLYNFEPRNFIITPKMMNCVVNRHCITQAIQKTGRFFHPPFPDYSACCQLLGQTTQFLVLDTPLYMVGISVASNAGARYNRQEKFAAYWSMHNEDFLTGQPYPMSSILMPFIQATLTRFHAHYPDKFALKTNHKALLTAMLTELKGYASEDDDITAELNELAAYMHQYSGSQAMFEQLHQPHQTPLGTAQASLPKRLHNWLRQQRQHLSTPPPVKTPNHQQHFTNMIEAAASLPALWPDPNTLVEHIDCDQEIEKTVLSYAQKHH